MDNIRYNKSTNELFILDQTILPNVEEEILLDTPEKMYDAIKFLKVRGAPAIGICAGYCMAVLARILKTNFAECDAHIFSEDDILSEALKNKIAATFSGNTQDCDLVSLFIDALQEYADYLNSSRPTAVNLNWALKRMMAAAKSAEEAYISTFTGSSEEKKSEALNKKTNKDFPVISHICNSLTCEAIKIHNEDIAMCKNISEYGLELVKDGDGILTHCNAGPLATSKYGTALGPILLGTERGMHFHVFADETRPLLQGARLTSYELFNAGVDVTLICDNMANTVMKKGLINAVFVGSDRIAANGDVANKIGTCGVAILAKYYGIPFYVLAPSSTIDSGCKCGDDIVIEERDPEEIKNMFYEKPMALPGVKCFNPAFDVTDHSLVSAIITEKGIFRPPYNFGV